MTGSQERLSRRIALGQPIFGLFGQARAGLRREPGQRQAIEIGGRPIALEQDQKIIASRFPFAQCFVAPDDLRQDLPADPFARFVFSFESCPIAPEGTAKIPLAKGGVGRLLLGRAGGRKRKNPRGGKQLFVAAGHAQLQSAARVIQDFAAPFRRRAVPIAGRHDHLIGRFGGWSIGRRQGAGRVANSNTHEREKRGIAVAAILDERFWRTA